MTIQQAIDRLKQIAEKHNGDVELFFDCPDCHRSFTPDLAATKAAVRIPAERPTATREDT